MAKSFIFDMDGVIINTENAWHKEGKQFLENLYGKRLYNTIKNELTGIRLLDEYELVKKHGFKMSKEEHLRRYTSQAEIIFKIAKITTGIVELIDLLYERGFIIVIVSSAPMSWIEMTLSKLPNRQKFKKIISLNDRYDLKGKPSPDGYLEAMRLINSNPNETMILEDSNKGLESAKASGAYTICLKENLPKEYISGEADLFVSNVQELIKFIELMKN